MMLFPPQSAESTEEGDHSTVVFLQDICAEHCIEDYPTYRSLSREEKDSVAMVCFPLSPKPHDLQLLGDDELFAAWTADEQI